MASPASLDALRRRAAVCTACDLYKRATQTVLGEGPVPARLLLVGEQPGHEEDLAGRPFVGPAGRILDRAMADAGLERGDVYITNAVKHFKWRPDPARKRPRSSASRGDWRERPRCAVLPRIFRALRNKRPGRSSWRLPRARPREGTSV